MLLLYICFVCRTREFPYLGLLPEVFCSEGVFVFSAFAAISFEILKTRKLE
jgi:hypothetical protein